MSQRGTYQTKQQDAVASLFQSQPNDCLTAEEAYELLARSGMDIGKTTVYRAISRLIETGILRRYAPHERGEAASYQYNRCRESHLHMRCISCGATEHLHCDEAESFAGHLTEHHGFILDEGQTILYGLCENCRNKENR